MKNMIVFALALALLLCACAENSGDAPEDAPKTQEQVSVPEAEEPKYVPEPVTSDTLFVKKVEGIGEGFIMGMDASSVIALEDSGVRYFGYDGSEQDVFRILADSGITHIRVRVWNDPYDENGNGYGGGNSDIEKCAEIGKRAARYGMKLIVDFHYSDFWADPAKQFVPKAWQGMSVEQKADALYAFTVNSLTKLKDEGCDVGMVSVGNETNQYFCGEKSWLKIALLMKSGAKAVREVFPDALVALHFANPENNSYPAYAEKLKEYEVDYDVFASSYYPYWHGTLDNLSAELEEVAAAYGKKTMIMETSWAYTAADTDFSGNTIGEGSLVTKNYPYTVQAQANCVRDVIGCAAQTRDCIGVCYWEGTWISVGTESWEANHEKWEKYGSGWASSYAAGYDPNDAGKYYGGCAVDNQAFFDADGRALESLKVWALVKTGNEIEVVPDAVEDVNLMIDLAGEIELPETVNAVMTDDSKQAISVKWDIDDGKIAAMKSGGVQKYDVTGEAGGFTAHAYVSMVEYNYLTNWSFEDGETGWTATDLAATEQLWTEDKQTDSLSGSKHYHFWSPGKDTVEFRLEQTVTDLRPGSYSFGISVMGGDCGETEIYAYALTADGEARSGLIPIEGYGNWNSGNTGAFEVTDGAVTVGIYVKCSGEGSGAWGKIDDALLNSSK